MAKITEVSTWTTAKINLGGYGSCDAGVSLKATLEDGDDAEQVARDLAQKARAQVAAELVPIVRDVRKRASRPDYNDTLPSVLQLASYMAGMPTPEEEVANSMKSGSNIDTIETKGDTTCH